MAKNAGVRLSSGGRIICPKMISPQYVLQSPRHRRSQRREQRAGWPSLKQAVGTRVLHDQLGSTKEGRPKSARGEGSQLAHGRFGTSLPRIAIHHALISGLLTGHSGPEPVVFCCTARTGARGLIGAVECVVTIGAQAAELAEPERGEIASVRLDVVGDGR